MRQGSIKTRVFAIKLLGENGDAETDLPLVVTGLRDADSRVRLASILAVRKLGPEGFPAIVELLSREQRSSNLKMAIKTLQHWGKAESLEPLVRLLRRDDRTTVQNFCFTAFERTTGRRLGKDVDAWEKYLESVRLKKQAEEMVGRNRPQEEA